MHLINPSAVAKYSEQCWENYLQNKYLLMTRVLNIKRVLTRYGLGPKYNRY